MSAPPFGIPPPVVPQKRASGVFGGEIQTKRSRSTGAEPASPSSLVSSPIIGTKQAQYPAGWAFITKAGIPAFMIERKTPLYQTHNYRRTIVEAINTFFMEGPRPLPLTEIAQCMGVKRVSTLLGWLVESGCWIKEQDERMLFIGRGDQPVTPMYLQIRAADISDEKRVPAAVVASPIRVNSAPSAVPAWKQQARATIPALPAPAPTPSRVPAPSTLSPKKSASFRASTPPVVAPLSAPAPALAALYKQPVPPSKQPPPPSSYSPAAPSAVKSPIPPPVAPKQQVVPVAPKQQVVPPAAAAAAPSSAAKVVLSISENADEEEMDTSHEDIRKWIGHLKHHEELVSSVCETKELRSNAGLLAKLRYHEYFLPEFRLWFEEYTKKDLDGGGATKDLKREENAAKAKKAAEEEHKSECVLCLSAVSQYASLCGHKCLCEKCANSTETCPICRKPVEVWIKIYDC